MKLWYLVRYAKNGTAKIHEKKTGKACRHWITWTVKTLSMAQNFMPSTSISLVNVVLPEHKSMKFYYIHNVVAFFHCLSLFLFLSFNKQII